MGSFIQKFHKYCLKFNKTRIVRIKVLETYLKFIIKCFTPKFLWSSYFITLGGNLSFLTFNIVIMNLRKPDIPVSRVKHVSKFCELFVRNRSMHDELLKFLKQASRFFI